MRTQSIQGQQKDKDSSCYFHHQEGLEHIFYTARNSARTILVSNNQTVRLDEDNVKTELAVEETISQSEQQLQNTDVGPSLQDEASAATSSAEHQQPETSEPSRTSTRNRKQPDRFGNLYPQTCLKKEGGCDGFKETSRNLAVFFNKVSKNERRTYLTNFIAVSISNSHKTKLNSNFVLALSLTY